MAIATDTEGDAALDLEERWHVHLPALGRVFDVHVDGVVSNWDLHVLLAHALAEHGVPVVSNAQAVIDNLTSPADAPADTTVQGTWNMYTHEALGLDLVANTPPTAMWVLGEGSPRDVPSLDGERVLVLGPASFVRTWNAQRSLHARCAHVRVAREWTPDEVRALGLAATRASSSEHADRRARSRYAPNVRVASAARFTWPRCCIRCAAPEPERFRELHALPRYVPWMPFKTFVAAPVCRRCDDAFVLHRARLLTWAALAFVVFLFGAWLHPLVLVLVLAEIVAFVGFDRFVETRFFGFRPWTHFTDGGFDAWVARDDVRASMEAATKPH